MDWHTLCFREVEDFYSLESITSLTFVTFHTGDLEGPDQIVSMINALLDEFFKKYTNEQNSSLFPLGYEVDDRRSYTSTGASAEWQQVIITVLDRSVDAAVGLLFAEILAWCRSRIKSDNVRATSIQEAIAVAKTSVTENFASAGDVSVVSAHEEDDGYRVIINDIDRTKYIVSINRSLPHHITVRRKKRSRKSREVKGSIRA